MKRILLLAFVASTVSAMDLPLGTTRMIPASVARLMEIDRTDSGFSIRMGDFVKHVHSYDVAPELRVLSTEYINRFARNGHIGVHEMTNGDMRLVMKGSLKGGVEPTTVAAAIWVAGIAIKMIREIARGNNNNR